MLIPPYEQVKKRRNKQLFCCWINAIVTFVSIIFRLFIVVKNSALETSAQISGDLEKLASSYNGVGKEELLRKTQCKVVVLTWCFRVTNFKRYLNPCKHTKIVKLSKTPIKYFSQHYNFRKLMNNECAYQFCKVENTVCGPPNSVCNWVFRSRWLCDQNQSSFSAIHQPNVA